MGSRNSELDAQSVLSDEGGVMGKEGVSTCAPRPPERCIRVGP